MQKHPENAEKVISAFQNPHAFNEEVSLQKNPNVDTYTQYFYNLLAMACLYAAMAGVTVAVENQGNLSTLAARKTVSARKKSSMIIGELIAATIFEFVLNLIGFFYLSYILKVGVDAVSYTHLDVYKRQGTHSPDVSCDTSSVFSRPCLPAYLRLYLCIRNLHYQYLREYLTG